MANKKLFNTKSNKTSSNKRMASDLVMNESGGGVAYAMSDKSALAQLVLTGCLGDTFYVSAESQLSSVLDLTKKIGSTKEGVNFIAKLAIFARAKGHMKDMPSILMAILAVRHTETYLSIYDRVIDNSKMFRVHLEMIRSGQVDGRKTFPNAVRRRNKKWFNDRNPNRLFRDNVGSPSLADLIKMLHPEPKDKQQEALFAYLCGKQKHEIKGKKFGATYEDLPSLVKEYEDFKNSSKVDELKAPDVPFEMLTSLPLKDNHWMTIAQNASWNMSKKNINTFIRHNVFKSEDMVSMVADRLASEELVKKAKVFPFEILSAYRHAENVPPRIMSALEQAMEYSTKNIPEISGEVYIFVDVSGSMSSPITGKRYGKKGTQVVQTKIRCIEAASLIAASIARKNPSVKVFCFDSNLHDPSSSKNKVRNFNADNSVFKNTEVLMSYHGGATNCSVGVQMLAEKKKKVDVIIYISDYESNIDTRKDSYSYYKTTGVLEYWDQIKKDNPGAKMICIDLIPNKTIQAKDCPGSVLNVGGFSDAVFDVMNQFIKYGDFSSNMVKFIEDEINLDGGTYSNNRLDDDDDQIIV